MGHNTNRYILNCHHVFPLGMLHTSDNLKAPDEHTRAYITCETHQEGKKTHSASSSSISFKACELPFANGKTEKGFYKTTIKSIGPW